MKLKVLQIEDCRRGHAHMQKIVHYSQSSTSALLSTPCGILVHMLRCRNT